MNPLVVFAIGIVLFHENVIDWISLALATIGVLIATIAYGAFPWIAIVLALSFGLYGTLKKARRRWRIVVFVEFNSLGSIAMIFRNSDLNIHNSM